MNQPISAANLTSAAEVFLGRQPILNNKQQTIAYELLFRSKGSLSNTNHDDLSATSTVIVNTLSQFGIDHVLDNKDGFLNVSASLLMSETIELLPPERIVLEILDDVPINGQLISRCNTLKALGFRIAIDGFVKREDYMMLLPLTDFVKIDLSVIPIEQAPHLIEIIKKLSSAKVIAEKVENDELFQACKKLGFDAFQGYFFAKPTILKGKKPQPQQMSLMRMMGMLLGDADLQELERMFKNNPTLTISLLKLVNSVGVNGGRGKIESIRQAIVVLGQKQLMRWVQLLLYASTQSESNNALMIQVANRARLMELISKKVDSYETNFGDQAFMVGMLSLADAVMQSPLTDILDEIGLSDKIKSAILEEKGTHGQLLTLAKALEQSDFDAANGKIDTLGISADDLLAIQLESIEWTSKLSK